MLFRSSLFAVLVILPSGQGLVSCATDDNSATMGPSATVADVIPSSCGDTTSPCGTNAPPSAASTVAPTPAASPNLTGGTTAQPIASGTSPTAPSTTGSSTPTSTGQASASSDPSTGTGGLPGTTGGAGGEATPGSGATDSGGAAGAAQGGVGGVSAQGGASGAPPSGGSGGQGTAPDRDARRMLLRDEGIAQLSYVDLAAPAENWHVPVPLGRDMQLVGAGRVMIGTENGYEERAISDGSQVAALTTYAGTLAAQRLRSGNTLLVGLNWQEQTGIVLVEVEPQGDVVRTINFPDFDYVRLVRPTATGTFLVTADDVVFEGDDAGNIVWQVTLSGQAEPHAWKALRLASGNTVVATGYNVSLQIFSPDEQLLDTITGPAETNPFFFCDFQLLAGGNFLVTNWQGHGADLGSSGTQLIEYAPSGEVVWSWQQDPSYVSSLQAVIALDGLDLERLHVEDTTGELVAVP